MSDMTFKMLATQELEFSQEHNLELDFIKLSRYGCYQKLLRTAAVILLFFFCFVFSNLKACLHYFSRFHQIKSFYLLAIALEDD